LRHAAGISREYRLDARELLRLLFALTLRDGFVGAQLKKEKQEATALGEGGETRSQVKVIPAAQRRVQKGLPPPAPLPLLHPHSGAGSGSAPLSREY